MNITQIAFKYRKTVFLIVALLLINGVFAYFTLPAQEDPTITIREAVIVTSFPGMAPERVEQLITKKLEEEVRKIPEVKEIKSLSTTGNSTIHVKIHDRYFNLDDIWQNVRNKASAAHNKMPSGTSAPFVNTEFGDVSVVTLALTADGFDMSAMYDIAQHIRDTLYAVEGTKKIEILGHLEERIFLEASNATLSQLGISPRALINELQNQNIIRSGGEIDTGAQSFIVEPSGNFNNVSDIANTYINIPNTEDFIALKECLGYKFKLAFNLSPCQLEDLSCPDKLALILKLNDLTPSEIILEITEQHALCSSAQLETLNRLRIRGFDISLDDYGIGFTNVNQLKTLPFSEVKIDRTLISHIETDQFSQVITSSLVNIAIQEGITIVAEGIERIEELEYLDRFKEFILMQGFLICKPKSRSEFTVWAKSWLQMVKDAN